MRLSLVMMSHSRRAVSGVQISSGVGRRYGASGALAPMNNPTGIAWVGDVRSDGHEDLGQAEDISVDIEADNGWSCRPGHAARWDVS